MSGFQGGVEGIENEIKSASITVIGAIATFGPKSASPLTSKEVREILLNDPGSLAAGTSLSKLGSIIILDCDNEDDADVAVSLGISEFPTVMLYQNGKVIRLLSGCDLTKQSVQLALSQEADETQLKSGNANFTSLPFPSLHFTSLHFTSLHFTSFPFDSLLLL